MENFIFYAGIQISSMQSDGSNLLVFAKYWPKIISHLEKHCFLNTIY